MDTNNKTDPVEALRCEALFGVLTRAGTFPVHDEETSGFVVSCQPAELAKIKRLPMYRDVALIEVRAWLDTQRKIGFLLGALEGLRWSVDGETRKKIDAIVAAEASPNTVHEPQARKKTL